MPLAHPRRRTVSGPTGAWKGIFAVHSWIIAGVDLRHPALKLPGYG